ncbi:gluconokinase [Noviherbaspirillum sp. 17J57-3]|uniref:Gluconokinase n=2 Tax=Noviherbaspirillum galbum TaxID=2709383 RepID=A0A6B3SG34_9BURK|nr:gluconokinase [Noviherbaspirillum galbum]
MGVSGCGKSEIGSRLAQALGFAHLEGDAFHPQSNIDKMAAGQPLTDLDRRDWLMVIRERIAEARVLQQGLVVSCSALKRSYRDLLRQGDEGLAFAHLDGAMELIAARMRARPNHFMPVSLLESQFRDLEPLQRDERGLTLDIRQEPVELVSQALRALQDMPAASPDNDRGG